MTAKGWMANATLPPMALAKSKRLVPCGGNGAHAFVLTEQFAESIRQRRRARWWSQSDLANAAGLSVRTVQEIETRGGKHVREETLARIEDALGPIDVKHRSPERSNGICVVEGCTRARMARALCRMHYDADRRRLARQKGQS